MSDQPINIDAPSYYVLPDGTELREVIRRFRGDYKTAEHLVQAVIEYAIRAGRKPDVTMVEDMRKVIRCAQQAVNILEGRHVSDNGDPPTACGTPDLSRVVGMLTRHGVVHLYERKDDLRAAMDSPDKWDRVMWTDGVRLHTADEPEPTLTPAPPPEPEPDQCEGGVLLPGTLEACHARIRRLDRELTEASEHLQKVIGRGVGILCVADAAKAIVEPLLKPHITLPVVRRGEMFPAAGQYVRQNRGYPLRVVLEQIEYGVTCVEDAIGPIPPACDWPRPEGEWEIEEA